MQFSAHLVINGETVKVLVRESKTRRQLKLRNTGTAGVFLEDESRFLAEDDERIQLLKEGNVVSL